MSYIRTIEPESATEELREVYAGIMDKRGKVSNIMMVQGLNPKAMKTHMDLYLAIMFGRSKLPREEREIIATVVSGANGCAYCQAHHAEALNRYWKDDDRLNALVEDYGSAGLPPRVLTMLGYALKLTTGPGSMTGDDIRPLRDAGMDDDEILDLNLVTAYFNFVNRIAMGLGVEYSEEEKKGYGD